MTSFVSRAPILALILVAVSHSSYAEPQCEKESEIIARLCPPGPGMQPEVTVSKNRRERGHPSDRVDCLTKDYAIEVEKSHNWKTAIGQALAYAVAFNRKPGVVLVCCASDCLKYSLSLQETVADQHRDFVVWNCGPSDPLGQCRRIDCDADGCREAVERLITQPPEN